MDTSQIAQIIRDRASANGVDPSVLLRIAQIESDLNPNASAKGSSAKGLFQFTKGTAAQYGLNDPYDPEASADAAARLVKANSAGLGASDPGSIYLAHFAGLGGAKKLMAADPSASAESVLGSDVVKANPFLARMTAGDVRNWASSKMGASPSVTTTAPNAQPLQTAPSAPDDGQPAAAQPTQEQADPSDAALSAFRQIYSQRLADEQLQPQQMNLLRQIVNPRRTVYLG